MAARWQHILKAIVEAEAEFATTMSADEIHALRRSTVEWLLGRPIGETVQNVRDADNTKAFLNGIRTLLFEKFPGADIEDALLDEDWDVNGIFPEERRPMHQFISPEQKLTANK